MSIIGKLFGTDKAISDGIGLVAKGFDSLVYTDEEKAENHAKDVSQARSMITGWMEASQGQRLSRRIIALSVTFTWLLMFIIGAVVSVCAIWATSPDNLSKTADILGNYADSMNGAVALIVGFYFAAPHLSDIVKPAMQKFMQRPEGANEKKKD